MRVRTVMQDEGDLVIRIIRYSLAWMPLDE
jgi:hypothetical protein